MRDAYSGAGEFDAEKVPPMPSSANRPEWAFPAWALPPLEIPMPPVSPPRQPDEDLRQQLIRLKGRQLRLSPAPVVQPYWKAIKHAGLRVEREVPPPPPPEFVWLHGEPDDRAWWIRPWVAFAGGALLALGLIGPAILAIRKSLPPI